MGLMKLSGNIPVAIATGIDHAIIAKLHQSICQTAKQLFQRMGVIDFMNIPVAFEI